MCAGGPGLGQEGQGLGEEGLAQLCVSVTVGPWAAGQGKGALSEWDVGSVGLE